MSIIQSIYNKLEYPAFIGGSLWGILSTSAGEIVIRVFIAFLGGAAATLGTHLVKCIINKLNNRNNGKR